MFSSLRSRLWLSYAFIIVTALIVVAIVLFIYLLRNPFLYRQTIERLNAVQTVLASRDGQPIRPAMDKAARSFDVRVILYSSERQILADTATDQSPIPFPRKAALNRQTPITRDEKGGAWLFSLTELPDGTWLMVASPRPRLTVMNVFTDNLLPLFWLGGLIALVLSLLVAFLFAKWIADPMQKVIAAARAMPSAEAKPVEVSGPQEVQDLTRSFNSMLARVQNSQRSQREFIANVSHELKTPLTSIQGFAQAILDGTAESPEARKQAAEVIYSEAGRMHRMVLDLLDLARLDAGTADLKMSALDTGAILNATVEKFSLQLQKAGVTMKAEIPQNLPTLIGDGDRLAQVFTNLVDNALKFTPPGGEINIRAAAGQGEMQVTVSDTGPGIPPQALPHIFDRFYQADRARKGGDGHSAGLGLAIVKQILEAHGGRISVRSGEAGTTFEVSLPLSQVNATTQVRRKK
ncbi:MAG: HAMP domain-containing sensor histidine kinase [Chloroflexota bacterium]